MNGGATVGPGREGTHSATRPLLRWLHVLQASSRPDSVQQRRMRQVTGHPITLSDFRALALIGSDAPLTISEVARALRVNLSRASRQMASLEKLGLVERFSNQSDGRSSRVLVSSSGAKAVRAWLELTRQIHADVLAAWPPADIRRFGELLAVLLAGLPPEGQPTRSLAEIDLSQWQGDADLHTALAATMPQLMALVWWLNESGATVAGTRATLVAAASPIPHQSLLALRIILRRGPMDLTELAAHLALDTSRASRLVSQLEHHGLIIRATDSVDARRKRIKASHDGAALARRIGDCEAAPFEAVFSTWDTDAVAELATLFERFVSEMLAEARAVLTPSR